MVYPVHLHLSRAVTASVMGTRIISAVAIAVSVLAVGRAHGWQGAPAADGVTVFGRVVDGLTGGGLPGAQVTLSGDTSSRSPAKSNVIADHNGSFQLALRSGAQVLLSTKLSGYSGGRYGQLSPGDSGYYFHVPENARRVNVVLKLWRTAVIVGRALDEHGDPVVGARVATGWRRSARRR